MRGGKRFAVVKKKLVQRADTKRAVTSDWTAAFREGGGKRFAVVKKKLVERADTKRAVTRDWTAAFREGREGKRFAS